MIFSTRSSFEYFREIVASKGGEITRNEIKDWRNVYIVGAHYISVCFSRADNLCLTTSSDSKPKRRKTCFYIFSHSRDFGIASKVDEFDDLLPDWSLVALRHYDIIVVCSCWIVCILLHSFLGFDWNAMGILFSFPDASSCFNLFFFWFGRERERERDSSSIERELYNHEHTQCVGSFSFFVLARISMAPVCLLILHTGFISLSLFSCLRVFLERGKD